MFFAMGLVLLIFAVFVGGFPLVFNGQIIGGVGISGGNGAQDKAVGAAILAEFEALTAAVGTH